MIKVKILDLRPTQFAVGMLEVEEKIVIARRYDRKKLRDYVDDNPVPVVIGPDARMYMVDHHHFVAVCYHLGLKKVRVRVQKDLSRRKMSYPEFWKWMWKSRNTYPFCQFGEGPRKSIYLPKDIRTLADDPYRSIAWFVRKAGAFENSDRNYAEFQWANFFRKKRLLDRGGMASLPQALAKAVLLAQSPAARRLPGFEKLRAAERKNVEKAAKKKGKSVERAHRR